MKRLSLLLMAALALAAPAEAAKRKTIAGEPLVIDGDTILLSLTKIRLLGIDAPEPDQTCVRDGAPWSCGLEAKAALADLVRGRRVTCDLNGRHSYGRPLGRCRLGATDLGAWLAEQGWAAVDPRFEQTYAPQQAKAKAARRGIWAGPFQLPCEFRGSC